MDDDSAETDADVDALIEEFGGDPRAAILALMHDIDVLARDYEANVSRGFARRDKAISVRTSAATPVSAPDQSDALR